MFTSKTSIVVAQKNHFLTVPTINLLAIIAAIMMMLQSFVNVRHHYTLYYISLWFSTSLSVVTDVTYSNCSNGAVRLTGGSNQYEGRVELCVNGVWGSVCDSGWDNREASTVCRQLGYQGLCFLAKYRSASFCFYSLFL